MAENSVGTLNRAERLYKIGSFHTDYREKDLYIY